MTAQPSARAEASKIKPPGIGGSIVSRVSKWSVMASLPYNASSSSFRDGPQDQTSDVHCTSGNPEVPGSRLARPGTTRGDFPSQPPLPPLETFQILETLALVAGSAEVKLLDVLVVAQFAGAAVEHHLALLHDVAVACDRQRGARVLLHQQNGDTEVAVDLLDDRENLLDQQRRQPHRRLVHQDHLRARHQRPADRQHLLLAAGEITRQSGALLQAREIVKDHVDIGADLVVASGEGAEP